MQKEERGGEGGLGGWGVDAFFCLVDTDRDTHTHTPSSQGLCVDGGGVNGCVVVKWGDVARQLLATILSPFLPFSSLHHHTYTHTHTQALALIYTYTHTHAQVSFLCLCFTLKSRRNGKGYPK